MAKAKAKEEPKGGLRYIAPRKVILDEKIFVRDVDRKDPKFKELVESVKALGTLIHPLVLNETKQGMRLVCGRQRLDACRQAKLKAVPYITVEGTDSELVHMALDENENRVPMSVVQEAEVLHRARKLLKKEKGKTPSNVLLAKRLNRSARWVADRFEILKLNDEMQKSLDDNSGEVTIGKVHELMRVHPQDRPKVVNLMRSLNLPAFRNALEKHAKAELKEKGTGIRWAGGKAKPRTAAAKAGKSKKGSAKAEKVVYSKTVKAEGAPAAEIDVKTPNQILKLVAKCEAGLRSETKKKKPDLEEVAYQRGQIHAYLVVLNLPQADSLKDALKAHDQKKKK